MQCQRNDVSMQYRGRMVFSLIHYPHAKSCLTDNSLIFTTGSLRICGCQALTALRKTILFFHRHRRSSWISQGDEGDCSLPTCFAEPQSYRIWLQYSTEGRAYCESVWYDILQSVKYDVATSSGLLRFEAPNSQ
jgi:hypothetical protein